MKLLLYRVASPGWSMGLNRYPDKVIGAYAVLGRRCLSFVWRKA